jgi:hypothetical protein
MRYFGRKCAILGYLAQKNTDLGEPLIFLQGKTLIFLQQFANSD